MSISKAVLVLTGITLCSHSHAQQQSDSNRGGDWLDGHDTPSIRGDESVGSSDTSVLGRSEWRKQNGEVLQLGFVNLRRVMASVPQLTTLRTRLDSEFALQKEVLDRQADEIQALETQLADMPRGEAYSELEKQVIAKRRTFARLDASFRDAYSVRRNEELATLQQMVVDEIVGLAKDEGYDVILNDTGVIFVSLDADLTLMVLERLQRQAGQGTGGN